MAYEALTLGAAITANQITNVPLTHVSGPVVLPALGATPSGMGVPCLCDSEFFYVVAQTASGVYSLRGRGSEGTAATAHDILANVAASLVNDFGNPQPGTTTTLDPAEDGPIALGQDQTIALTGVNNVYNINKGSAAALLLGPPNLADNGVTLVFTSNTAFAHTIGTINAAGVSTALLMDGTSGAPKTTASFAAFKGATLILVAENGFWNVSGSPQNVTFS